MIEKELREARNLAAPMPEPNSQIQMEGEYRPSKQSALRDYEINIKFLSRGCVVKVGCKEIPFEDVSKAMSELNEYVIGDTYEIQQKWRNLLD